MACALSVTLRDARQELPPGSGFTARRLSALVHHEVEAQRIALSAGVRRARDLAERVRVVVGEPSVARRLDVDFGEIQTVGERDRLGVEVGTADEEDLVG